MESKECGIDFLEFPLPFFEILILVLAFVFHALNRWRSWREPPPPPQPPAAAAAPGGKVITYSTSLEIKLCPVFINWWEFV